MDLGVGQRRPRSRFCHGFTCEISLSPLPSLLHHALPATDSAIRTLQPGGFRWPSDAPTAERAQQPARSFSPKVYGYRVTKECSPRRRAVRSREGSGAFPSSRAWKH